MPAFVSHVPVNLDKLFQDGAVATRALGSKTSGVMEVAIYVAVVLIIRVLGSEKCWAERTGKMLHMKFLVCRQKSENSEAKRVERERTASRDIASP